MEIVFFIAREHEAQGVASSDDLPGDPATEPMDADGPAALQGLGEALGLGPERAAVRLRDATCRSFPVWSISSGLCTCLETLDDAGIDAAAEAWKPGGRSDAWERATGLTDLRDALRRREPGEGLFALFEERAF